ncbi:MAG: hypothetical protein MR488_10935 [Lachnospiraceae bacterium]|nr:hypothetical protein [Lachnospiraceae bacterium]
MPTRIKLNTLDFSYDEENLCQEYQILEIRTDSQRFDYSSPIFDLLLLKDRVLAVVFDRGNRFWTLRKRATASSVKDIRGLLRSADEADTITIKEVRPSALKKHHLLQLLLNASGNFLSDGLRYCNLTGRLYCFQPSWMDRKADDYHEENSKGTVWQIHAVEIHVAEDMTLELKIRTFSNVLLALSSKKHITFTKKRPLSSYAQYGLSSHNTLYRLMKMEEQENEPQNRFILRATDGDHYSKTAFLNVGSLVAFEKTKLGILTDVLAHFWERYGEAAAIQFQTIEDDHFIAYDRAVQKEEQKRIADCIRRKPVRVVDMVRSTASAALQKDLIKAFAANKDTDIPAIASDYVSEDAYNICLIHSKEYYGHMQEAHDPHRLYPDAAVQHITIENAGAKPDSLNFITQEIIHELIIKQDLSDGRIQLFDWSRCGIKEPILFGICISGEQEEENETDEKPPAPDRFLFMKIQPDGTFHMHTEEYNPFSSSEYQDCMMACENVLGSRVDGIVQYEDHQIDLIVETNEYPIPEIQDLRNELQAGNTKLRNEKAVERYLCACTDIHSYRKDGQRYYFVGVIGKGMRANVKCASPIRKIESVNGNADRFGELLKLMNVCFVRNKQLTVLPFPFKYLREKSRLK